MKLQIDTINRVVLLGGGKLLVAIAKRCQSKGIPVSIVTSPRHSLELIENDTSLCDIFKNANIPYFVTGEIDSTQTQEFIGSLSNTLCLSVAAAWQFTEQSLSSIFKHKLLNLHGTRLPQNRGGGGFSWQIMMGNRLGFCQLHVMDSGLDTGNIVETHEFLYPPSCRKPIDYETLYIKENLLFATNFIEKARSSDLRITTVPQSEYLSTYWPRLSTIDNAWIDWRTSVENVERFICAFDDPYEGAQTLLNNSNVFIKNVSIDYSDPQFHPYQAGIIYRKNSQWLSVCANGGTLIIETILDDEGCSILNEVNVGDRLFTPSENLDNRMKKITYTPAGKETK